MDASEVSVENKSVGKCLLDNWVEERATASLDNAGPRTHIHKHGHRGILTMEISSKVQGVSTVKSTYTPPKGPGVRERGLRGELLEKFLLKKISEQTYAELNPEPPATELCSTTRADYILEGFQSVIPPPSMEHDYKTEQALSFWSDNYQQIQGISAIRTRDTPFKKNTTFSTPISERLDDPMPYTPENYPNM